MSDTPLITLSDQNKHASSVPVTMVNIDKCVLNNYSLSLGVNMCLNFHSMKIVYKLYLFLYNLHTSHKEWKHNNIRLYKENIFITEKTLSSALQFFLLIVSS